MRRSLAIVLACVTGGVAAQSASYEWQPLATPVGGGGASGGIYRLQACADGGGETLTGGTYSVSAGPCAALAAIGDDSEPPPAEAIFASGFEG
jgi:hypothetical protein